MSAISGDSTIQFINNIAILIENNKIDEAYKTFKPMETQLPESLRKEIYSVCPFLYLSPEKMPGISISNSESSKKIREVTAAFFHKIEDSDKVDDKVLVKSKKVEYRKAKEKRQKEKEFLLEYANSLLFSNETYAHIPLMLVIYIQILEFANFALKEDDLNIFQMYFLKGYYHFKKSGSTELIIKAIKDKFLNIKHKPILTTSVIDKEKYFQEISKGTPKFLEDTIKLFSSLNLECLNSSPYSILYADTLAPHPEVIMTSFKTVVLLYNSYNLFYQQFSDIPKLETELKELHNKINWSFIDSIKMSESFKKKIVLEYENTHSNIIMEFSSFLNTITTTCNFLRNRYKPILTHPLLNNLKFGENVSEENIIYLSQNIPLVNEFVDSIEKLVGWITHQTNLHRQRLEKFNNIGLYLRLNDSLEQLELEFINDRPSNWLNFIGNKATAFMDAEGRSLPFLAKLQKIEDRSFLSLRKKMIVLSSLIEKIEILLVASFPLYIKVCQDLKDKRIPENMNLLRGVSLDVSQVLELAKFNEYRLPGGYKFWPDRKIIPELLFNCNPQPVEYKKRVTFLRKNQKKLFTLETATVEDIKILNVLIDILYADVSRSDGIKRKTILEMQRVKNELLSQKKEKFLLKIESGVREKFPITLESKIKIDKKSESKKSKEIEIKEEKEIETKEEVSIGKKGTEKIDLEKKKCMEIPSKISPIISNDDFIKLLNIFFEPINSLQACSSGKIGVKEALENTKHHMHSLIVLMEKFYRQVKCGASQQQVFSTIVSTVERSSLILEQLLLSTDLFHNSVKDRTELTQRFTHDLQLLLERVQTNLFCVDWNDMEIILGVNKGEIHSRNIGSFAKNRRWDNRLTLSKMMMSSAYHWAHKKTKSLDQIVQEFTSFTKDIFILTHKIIYAFPIGGLSKTRQKKIFAERDALCHTFFQNYILSLESTVSLGLPVEKIELDSRREEVMREITKIRKLLTTLKNNSPSYCKRKFDNILNNFLYRLEAEVQQKLSTKEIRLFFETIQQLDLNIAEEVLDIQIFNRDNTKMLTFGHDLTEKLSELDLPLKSLGEEIQLFCTKSSDVRNIIRYDADNDKFSFTEGSEVVRKAVKEVRMLSLRATTYKPSTSTTPSLVPLSLTAPISEEESKVMSEGGRIEKFVHKTLEDVMILSKLIELICIPKSILK